MEGMKNRLIEAAIDAVAARGGVRGVSLREVARNAGCSHVNAYRHADGLRGLLWMAYATVLGEFERACLEGAAERRPGENFGAALAGAMAAFAIEKEGLYRLLWSDDLGGAPAGDALAAIVEAKAHYDTAVKEALRADGFAGEERELSKRSDWLFAYLQGETTLLVNGRNGPDKPKAAEFISQRAGGLWELLAAHPPSMGATESDRAPQANRRPGQGFPISNRSARRPRAGR